jgi:putative methylase
VQRRLVRKIDLEKSIAEIQPHPSPRAYFEQYTIPPDVAAEILCIAAYTYNDIVDRKVVDLGCGTGRLAIGAALLGAKETIGIDIDKKAIKTAKGSAEKFKVEGKINWILGDIDVLRGYFDTILQNPPFGVQRKGADRKFIQKALELTGKVYSLHKSGESNRTFIKRFIELHGGKVTGIFQLEMTIPKMFEFHTKRKHSLKVDLYLFEGKKYVKI